MTCLPASFDSGYVWPDLITQSKLLYTADMLSRASLDTEEEETTEFPAEVEAFVDGVIQSLPAMSRQLEIYRRAQAEDSICTKVIEYCQSSWPEKRTLDISITPYWKVRGSISVQNSVRRIGTSRRSRREIMPSLPDKWDAQYSRGHRREELLLMLTIPSGYFGRETTEKLVTPSSGPRSRIWEDRTWDIRSYVNAESNRNSISDWNPG